MHVGAAPQRSECADAKNMCMHTNVLVHHAPQRVSAHGLDGAVDGDETATGVWVAPFGVMFPRRRIKGAQGSCAQFTQSAKLMISNS